MTFYIVVAILKGKERRRETMAKIQIDTEKLSIAVANAKLAIAPGDERDSADRQLLVDMMDEAIGYIKDAQVALEENPETW